MIEKNTSPTKFAHFLYCPIKLVLCLTVYVFGSWGFVQLFFVVAVYQHPVFLFWIVSWCDPLSSDVVPCVLMWPRVSWGDPLCPEAEVTPYVLRLRWPLMSWGDPLCPEVTPGVLRWPFVVDRMLKPRYWLKYVHYWILKKKQRTWLLCWSGHHYECQWMSWLIADLRHLRCYFCPMTPPLMLNTSRWGFVSKIVVSYSILTCVGIILVVSVKRRNHPVNHSSYVWVNIKVQSSSCCFGTFWLFCSVRKVCSFLHPSQQNAGALSFLSNALRKRREGK